MESPCCGARTRRRCAGDGPKHGEAMPAADRQRLYASARHCDMAEVAHALRQALRSEAERAMFIEIYRGTLSGQRLRRSLACLLHDDPATLAFFDDLILSYDEK